MTMLDPGPLRHEAEQEPDPVPTGPITKETQIIAIYGKGGSGKSFALAAAIVPLLRCNRIAPCYGVP